MDVQQPQGSWKVPKRGRPVHDEAGDDNYNEVQKFEDQRPGSKSGSERYSGVDVNEDQDQLPPTKKKPRGKNLVNWQDVVINQEFARSRDSTAGVEVGQNRSLHDGGGTFEITVKTYFPDDDQPGGAFLNILATIPIGEQVNMRDPKGDIIYRGRGRFSIFGKERRFKRVSLVLGGTGLSPGFSVLARSILDPEDQTELLVLDSNKTESDIPLRDELDHLERISYGRLKITHVLSDMVDEWKGLTGFIDKDMMAEHLFPSSEVNLALLCGPPIMIENAVRPGLEDLGYVSDRNMFNL